MLASVEEVRPFLTVKLEDKRPIVNRGLVKKQAVSDWERVTYSLDATLGPVAPGF